jgi:phosphotransferase system HPr-like phosphotransfer protein
MPFDMDLQIGSRVVDAKSILGIIYLGFGRVLNLKLNKENVAEAKAALADYVIA